MDIAANAQAAEETMVVRVKEWNQRQQARLEYEAKCASLFQLSSSFTYWCFNCKKKKKSQYRLDQELEHQYRLDQEAREARVGDLDAELAEMLSASLPSGPKEPEEWHPQVAEAEQAMHWLKVPPNQTPPGTAIDPAVYPTHSCPLETRLPPPAAACVTCTPPSHHVSDEGPDEFYCPITCELMEDPVLAADGHSYERQAIEAWLATHSTSPKSGQELPSAALIPNHALRNIIADWAK